MPPDNIRLEELKAGMPQTVELVIKKLNCEIHTKQKQVISETFLRSQCLSLVYNNCALVLLLLKIIYEFMKHSISTK